MLYITTKENKMDIADVEAFFSALPNKADSFGDEKYRDAMNRIDHAEYLNDGVIRTQMGVTSVEHLSSGCKAILLILMLNGEDKTISIAECGNNAIDYIYELSKDIDIKVYINRGFAIRQQNCECVINDQYVRDAWKIYEILEEETQ